MAEYFMYFENTSGVATETLQSRPEIKGCRSVISAYRFTAEDGQDWRAAYSEFYPNISIRSCKLIFRV